MYKKLLFIVMLGLITVASFASSASATELQYCYEDHNGKEICESVDQALERAKEKAEKYGLSGPSPDPYACAEEPNPCILEPIAEFTSETNTIDFIRELWGSDNETLLVTTESEQKYLLNLALEELIWISEPTDVCTPLYCKEWEIFTPVNCSEVCQTISISDMSIGNLWEYFNEDAGTLLLQDIINDSVYLLDYKEQLVMNLEQLYISCNNRPCPIGPNFVGQYADECLPDGKCRIGPDFSCEITLQNCPFGPNFDSNTSFAELSIALFASEEATFFLTNTQGESYLVDLVEGSLTFVTEPTEICTPLYCKEWQFSSPLYCQEQCASVALEDISTMGLQELIGQSGGMVLLQNTDLENENLFYVVDFDENIVVDLNQ